MGVAGKLTTPKSLTRLAQLLPAGTMVTGVGVLVLGVASYVHLAIAGHSLSTDEMANLSVLWSVVFSLGYGLFLPVEQEITRVVAARRSKGLGSRPVWRRGYALAGLIFAGLTALFAVASQPLADRLFVGDVALIAVTLGGLFGVAAASPVRGQAAGAARFELYGSQLGLDGVLRIILAVLLAFVGVHSAISFGLILFLAPALATLALLVPVGRTATSGPETSWSELGRGVWPLMISVLLGQFMLNSVIVSARIMAPEQTALSAALLVALVLVRIPALMFGALQASLLSALASAAADLDRAQFIRLLRHAVVIVTAMMACFAVAVVATGPWLVRTLFAAPDVLNRIDFALLAAGTWMYLLGLVLGQGAMSLHRHRLQMFAWMAGALVLVVITVLPGPVLTRLEWAYLAGNATVAICMAASLLVPGRLHWPRHAVVR